MPSVDKFSNFQPEPDSGALSLVAITPSDANDLTNVLRQIFVGVAGDVALLDTSGSSTIHKNVAAGSYIGPFKITRVLATGTTATNMVGYV